MRAVCLLLIAALLETGGDALIRTGLRGRGVTLMVAGVAVLAAYGFTVNLTNLDFGRLMGLYIVLFFLVAQAIAVLVFNERLPASTWYGGALVVAGGLVMALWPAAT